MGLLSFYSTPMSPNVLSCPPLVVSRLRASSTRIHGHRCQTAFGNKSHSDGAYLPQRSSVCCWLDSSMSRVARRLFWKRKIPVLTTLGLRDRRNGQDTLHLIGRLLDTSKCLMIISLHLRGS
ncbi:hypothetical protein HMN09_01023400 [Mycena chlorophos]|uniref:Uncharacterized protein n=1 Tax=Mycena chlorophos TaxID=658473 RepID=A0A8H6W1D0_MYCCL|nr:hypothetical protein HMN09_01023400 [Mycena chlorophos]